MHDDATHTQPPEDAATHTQPPDANLTHTRVPTDPAATRSQSDDEKKRSKDRSTNRPQIPGYALLEEIGEGGMGVVYKAIQLKLNRVVALKMIQGGKTASAKELIRFLAEAEAVAAIDHPHVVKVFDTGDAGGHPYLAMEYLPGGSLAEAIKQSPERQRRVNLAPKEAADLIRKLALAVQAAHDCQIVHRDLKPSNVLFDANHEPRVVDFGLAKKAGGGDLTNTNAIMGTAAYMAPEQAKGESKFVGPAADVWALGVILYECLAGARPFTGSHDIEIIRKVIDDQPGSIRSHVAALPKDLELIVEKCLAKDPTGRYASAAALAEDLRRWLHGEPVSVKAAGPIERSVKWVKRNKIAAGIVAGLSLAVAVTTATAIIALIASNRAESEAQRADRENEAAKTSAQRADRESEAAKSSAQRADHEAKMAKTEAARADENAGKLAVQLREQRNLLDAMRIREAGYLIDQNNYSLARTLLEEVEPRHWLNPGNRTSAWHLVRQQAEGSDWPFFELDGRFIINCLSVSPDGRTLAIGSDHTTVQLMNVATGAIVKELLGHTGGITGITWSPDGRKLASSSWDKTLHIWDAATGASLKELKGHTDTVESVSWSPDGGTLASGQSGQDRASLECGDRGKREGI